MNSGLLRGEARGAGLLTGVGINDAQAAPGQTPRAGGLTPGLLQPIVGTHARQQR
jgi:hypothetical protein